ncbi:MAG: hypothetical protein CMK74_02030 [Pseudomonadales bacterium]|nr:hypothetical protein [Pseudomonadales bacterium]|tara:strand:- start:1601 stop:1957 length:357 start_codon:yes stop_codon:yes gene_type:complete
MKTDRELLELAAKAAGYEVSDCTCQESLRITAETPRSHKHWNPLADSGDALRLAVELGLTIQIDRVDDLTRILDDAEETICVHMHFGGGALVATRHAITRAAADIGEKMAQAELSREA